jgi:hypothetical protein
MMEQLIQGAQYHWQAVLLLAFQFALIIGGTIIVVMGILVALGFVVASSHHAVVNHLPKSTKPAKPVEREEPAENARLDDIKPAETRR